MTVIILRKHFERFQGLNLPSTENKSMFLDVDSTENTANRRSVDSHATIGSYTDCLRRSQIRTHANVPNEGETFRSFAARVRRKADM